MLDNNKKGRTEVSKQEVYHYKFYGPFPRCCALSLFLSLSLSSFLILSPPPISYTALTFLFPPGYCVLPALTFVEDLKASKKKTFPRVSRTSEDQSSVVPLSPAPDAFVDAAIKPTVMETVALSPRYFGLAL